MTLHVICFHHFPKRRHRKRHHSPNRSCCAFPINDAKRYQKRYLSQYLHLHFQIPNRIQHLLHSHQCRANLVQECHYSFRFEDLLSFAALPPVRLRARSPPSPSSSCRGRYRTRSSVPGVSLPSHRYLRLPWRRCNSPQGICRECRYRAPGYSGIP